MVFRALIMVSPNDQDKASLHDPNQRTIRGLLLWLGVEVSFSPSTFKNSSSLFFIAIRNSMSCLVHLWHHVVSSLRHHLVIPHLPAVSVLPHGSNFFVTILILCEPFVPKNLSRRRIGVRLTVLVHPIRHWYCRSDNVSFDIVSRNDTDGLGLERCWYRWLDSYISNVFITLRLIETLISVI